MYLLKRYHVHISGMSKTFLIVRLICNNLCELSLRNKDMLCKGGYFSFNVCNNCVRSFCNKVRKKAKTRNRYNQVPHLTQDTIWQSDKKIRKHHTQES